MASASLCAAFLFAALSVLLFGRLLKYRSRIHRMKGDIRSPIPLSNPDALHPCFTSNSLGYDLQAEVRFIGTGPGAAGQTSDTEAWILAVLAKHSVRMFEFGTATGRTTYLWAANSPASARIHTITLHPEQHDKYQPAHGDNQGAGAYALRESAYSRFVYTGTPVADKVVQLFGDSKQFDDGPFAGTCDLIFIDGAHTYSYVKSDSEKALRMLAPGGIILWHDYREDLGRTLDVVRYLNELAGTLPLMRFRNTSFVAYRRGGARP